MRCLKNVACRLRDSVRLSTDVYLPDDEGRFPAILMRTPYGKEHLPTEPLYCFFPELVADGYAVACQDMRGTGESQGVIGLNGDMEQADGYDAVEWLASQPWCDGQVGMFGLSYPGFTQTAAAAGAPPHLKAICPFMSPSLHSFGVRQPHALHMEHLFWAYSQLLAHPTRYLPDDQTRERTLALLQENMRQLPALLIELPLTRCRAADIAGVPMLADYRDVIENADTPAFWERMHMPIDYDRVHTAAFFGTGWLDGAKEWTIAGYMAARGSRDAYTRENARLLIGPWPHGGEMPRCVEGTDFGEAASGEAFGVAGSMRRWFDRCMKERDADALPRRVAYFTRGSNAWRDAEDWPPPEARTLTLYLDGDALRLDRPAAETALRYDADPMDPAPSSIRDTAGRRMTADWRQVSERVDVLLLVSQPMTSPLLVAGTARVALCAATSAKDTDFACRLLDIDPEGRQTELAAGLVRASYCKGLFERTPVVPDEKTVYAFDVGNTANCFLPGHRVGLQICSALYPDYNRNLQTGEPSNTGAAFAVARQTIYCGGRDASRLMLPVIETQPGE